jgi:hypothetical protein
MTEIIPHLIRRRWSAVKHNPWIDMSNGYR